MQLLKSEYYYSTFSGHPVTWNMQKFGTAHAVPITYVKHLKQEKTISS